MVGSSAIMNLRREVASDASDGMADCAYFSGGSTSCSTSRTLGDHTMAHFREFAGSVHRQVEVTF